MEIDTVLRTLNLTLAGIGIQGSWEGSYGYLYRKDRKVSGIELMAAGPCTVITYCTASFTRYDEDIREYGLTMYIKHRIEQIFECVPFFHLEYPDEYFRFTIVDFKPEYRGLDGDRGSEECAQVSMS